MLAGRPLLAWAVGALREAGLAEVVVVAKRDTPLPDSGAGVWVEPDEPRHPLAGIVHALERAGGPVVTLPVDQPLVPPAVLRALAAAAGLTVARAGGEVQPLVGRFEPGVALPAEGRATDTVLALDPAFLDFAADGFVNVNAPGDLAAAEAVLSRR